MTGLTQVPDKHLEGELTTERNFNRALLQAFPAGLFTVDSNRCVLSLNPEAERLLGWSKSSCVGADLHNLIGCSTVESDELGRDRCSIDRVLETGKPTWARQAYIRCRNGVLKPVEFKCIPVTSHHSLGAIFCFRDLTSQLRLEQDLHRLASMPEQSPEPIVEFDAEANFIYANRVMMELLDAFGFSPGGFPRILPSNVTELVLACLGSGESLHGV